MNELYKKRLRISGSTVGASRKKVSDLIMNHTWDNDIQSRKCYIYDYFHDDEQDKYKNLEPYNSDTKIEVDIKFIISQYATLSKDQVEYHIMFRPGFKNPLDYYQEQYTDKYHSEFPIGLYIDIPNDEGIYYRWIICSKEIGNQFIKYLVLPCNYKFQWIFDNRKYEMWGIARLRNSYNSGLWTDFKSTTVENQDSIWIPINTYSENLYYNQRIIVSQNIYNPSKGIFPITWKVSKVEGLHPFGIQKVVLFQDRFNSSTDLVEMDDNDNIIGMWADYYKISVEPSPDKEHIQENDYSKITYSGTNHQVIIDGSYKTLDCRFYNEAGEEIHRDIGDWKFVVGDYDINSYVSIQETDDANEIKFKLNNMSSESDRPLEWYSGDYITISISDINGDCKSEIQLELITL